MGRFHRLRTDTVAFAAAGVVVISAAIIATELWWPEGPFKAALSPILYSVLAVFVVSLVWDLALHASWTNEILRMVNLEASLARAGVKSVASESAVPWAEFISGMNEFDFVVPDLNLWLNGTWKQFQDAVPFSGELTLRLYVPDPDDVENRLWVGLDSATYETQRKDQRDRWQELMASRQLQKQSSMSMWALPPSVGMTFARAQRDKGRACREILVASRLGAKPGQGGVAFYFEHTGTNGRDVHEWIGSQFQSFASASRKIVL